MDALAGIRGPGLVSAKNKKAQKGDDIMGLDKKVADLIIKAQISSDLGKGMDDRCYMLPFGSDHLDTDARSRITGFGGNTYNLKETFIRKAIRRVLKNRSCGFHVGYSVQTIWMGEYVESPIIYFSFRDEEGNKRQVSFHCPHWSEQEVRGLNKTRWDHGDSQETVAYLDRLCRGGSPFLK